MQKKYDKIINIKFIIILILVLILIMYISQIYQNSILIMNYKNNKFDEEYARKLSNGGFFQKYVSDYNYGNILYRNGKYEEAMFMYEDALQEYIPKYKECAIRVNYALAICKTVTVDEKDQESINRAISLYETAIYILQEDGCAGKDSDYDVRSFY